MEESGGARGRRRVARGQRCCGGTDRSPRNTNPLSPPPSCPPVLGTCRLARTPSPWSPSSAQKHQHEPAPRRTLLSRCFLLILLHSAGAVPLLFDLKSFWI